MLCDDCKKNQAVVRLVSIVDGRKSERNLCPQCMARQKLQMQAKGRDGVQSMLSAIWSGVHRAGQQHPGLVCSRCGMAYDEFVKSSRLGCAQCYKDFRTQMKPLLTRLHGHTQHIGHVPEHADEAVTGRTRIEQLRREMDIAIACEDFEVAAILRDELRELTALVRAGEAEERA